MPGAYGAGLSHDPPLQRQRVVGFDPQQAGEPVKGRPRRAGASPRTLDGRHGSDTLDEVDARAAASLTHVLANRISSRGWSGRPAEYDVSHRHEVEGVPPARAPNSPEWATG